MNVVDPIDRKILARVKTRGNGWVFSAADLVDLGSRDALDKALSRLAADGTIRRLARGLYDRPESHPIVGTTPPSIDQLAKAVAGKSGIRIQPTGAYAANLLGLSNQVPAKVVFLTDGRSKRLQVGNLQIVFRQASPRTMATAGRISGLFIQALRHLGKANVTEDTIGQLDRRLSVEEKRQLIKDLKYAPAWVADIMKRLGTNQ